MANLPETSAFDAGIFQLETTTPALGGPTGPMNDQAKGLANRTQWLKGQVEALAAGKVAQNGLTGLATTHNIRLGWDSVGIRAQVDSTSMGRLDHFPAGTKLLFPQNTAPPGWTKDTNPALNHALRVTGGTAGWGNGATFTAAFASRALSGAVQGHTLAWNEMPVHNHSAWTDSQGHHGHNVRINGNEQLIGTSLNASGGGYGSVASWQRHGDSYWGDINAAGAGAHAHNVGVGNAGSGWAHAHGLTINNLDMAVQYVDVIIATKDALA